MAHDNNRQACMMPVKPEVAEFLKKPDARWRLSDGEVADVLNFVRINWGNHAAAIGSEEVGRVRKALTLKKTASNRAIRTEACLL